jgi:hypothetical protein
MEASDLKIAKITPKAFFINGKSVRYKDVQKMDLEWWTDTATSPPLFD